MKFVGKTYNDRGRVVSVYECESCGARAKNRRCYNCERLIREKYKEEAALNII